jgi:hypothetical protein
VFVSRPKIRIDKKYPVSPNILQDQHLNCVKTETDKQFKTSQMGGDSK